MSTRLTKYSRTFIEAPAAKTCHALKATLRCLNIRGGTVANSPFQNWIRTKIMARTPQRVRSAIIRPLLHSYLVPPHCKASSKQAILIIKTTVPGISNCFDFSTSERDARFGLLMDVKKKLMTIKVMAPKGRLMKKHHLQVKRVVKAPPINGAVTVAMPYMLLYDATKIGRRARGSESARILVSLVIILHYLGVRQETM
jgi:hypothetical protein